ncbi:MAG: Transcriptional regulator containing AAA-type ATPase, and DNA-binding domain [Clostridiales bacterium]|nr:Transcriptional regulator containing AAA-type ATPase, and DNA-binding domain [Clostridiales bacterium]
MGVIGPISMILGAEGLSDIVGPKIKTYITKYHAHLQELVEQAASEGCEIIIGGIKVIKYARDIGLQGILLHTGKESLWHAITEAKRVARISRIEQEKTQLFRTILDHAYEGVIAVDKKNEISVFNSTAQKILRINRKDAAGSNANDIIPKSKLIELLEDEAERLDEIIGYRDIQLAVNKVPIMLKNENVGNVITFQDVTRIQELDGKIREKIHARGHVAKHNFDDIIGISEKIKETKQIAKRISKVDSNTLIIGETGTGKELFAQSIHNSSPRSKGPFVAVNCAALPENLLESELFGYVEGAFTGAAKGGKPGLFELAHKGTIFLDEIAELSLKLQGRLLRVIQEKEIMRLGHDRVIPVNVRIITATNKDLFAMVTKGDFREDLYYRLDVLKLSLPPLIDRREDIPLIVNKLLHSYAHLSEFKDISISENAMKLMQSFGWPGNIRELGNICERLIVFSQSPIIDEKSVTTILDRRGSVSPIEGRSGNNMHSLVNNNEPENIKEVIDNKVYEKPKKYLRKDENEESKDLERQRIQEALELEKYNKAKTAERLGIHRTTLLRRMKELNII